MEPFHYEKTGIGPVGKSYDVFRDGSVILINTPGHPRLYGGCGRSPAIQEQTLEL